MFLLMMSPMYLSDEELEARNRLNFRAFASALRYGGFASEFGWDQKVVDRNDESYLSDMNAYVSAKGQATAAYSDTERMALAKRNDAEDLATRDKPLDEIRDINWLAYGDLTDTELTKMIRRGERKRIGED